MIMISAICVILTAHSSDASHHTHMTATAPATIGCINDIYVYSQIQTTSGGSAGGLYMQQSGPDQLQ